MAESAIANRFRGFLPVVVDVETGGFDAEKNALLEIAATIIELHDDHLSYDEIISTHVEPFEGAEISQKSLEITGIDVGHPFRFAKPEREALQHIFRPIRRALRRTGCQRAILVGHNPAFDLAFLNAAVRRTSYKRNPFHPFSSFDTATLAGIALGETVLGKALQATGLEFDPSEAHGAVYDTERTAALFCRIANEWPVRRLNRATES